MPPTDVPAKCDEISEMTCPATIDCVNNLVYVKYGEGYQLTCSEGFLITDVCCFFFMAFAHSAAI